MVQDGMGHYDLEIPRADCEALQGLDMRVQHELGDEDDVEGKGEMNDTPSRIQSILCCTTLCYTETVQPNASLGGEHWMTKHDCPPTESSIIITGPKTAGGFTGIFD